MAGKSPLNIFKWRFDTKITDKWSIFQQAMFDYIEGNYQQIWNSWDFIGFLAFHCHAMFGLPNGKPKVGHQRFAGLNHSFVPAAACRYENMKIMI